MACGFTAEQIISHRWTQIKTKDGRKIDRKIQGQEYFSRLTMKATWERYRNSLVIPRNALVAELARVPADASSAAEFCEFSYN
jgi:hypothetical protein